MMSTKAMDPSRGLPHYYSEHLYDHIQPLPHRNKVHNLLRLRLAIEYLWTM